MLNTAKKAKLSKLIKTYSKKYLHSRYSELDESGTRLMINTFLTDILGYTAIEEVKTEYMIKGTYADYVVQIKGVRHFLVEVKALSINLSENHLRQAINYGANEGIEWALLTNGKQFDFYKILFNKPIEARKVFGIDLSDENQTKNGAEILQFLHKESVANKGLHLLWNKSIALDPNNIAGFLCSDYVANFIRKSLNKKYKYKFTEEEINNAIYNVLEKGVKLECVKQVKIRKNKKKINAPIHEILPQSDTTEMSGNIIN